MIYGERCSRTALFVGQNGEAEKLKRIPFMSASFNEAWLQELIERNPSIIPSGEVGGEYAPLVCIGREVPVGSGDTQGYIDNLYVTPSGNVVVVETKLFRNQESRRTVVAQIIDYAKELQKWDAEKLDEVASDYFYRTDGQAARIIDVMARLGHLNLSADGQLTDSINQNLRSASFLLFIIGDGIRSSVQQLADFLNENASMSFNLALAELEVYQHDEGVIVIPNLLTKTTVIERSVVSFGLSSFSGQINSAAQDQKQYVRKPILSRREFIDIFADNGGYDPDQVTELIADIESLDGLSVAIAPTELTIRFSPGGDSSCALLTFGISSGHADLYVMPERIKKALERYGQFPFGADRFLDFFKDYVDTKRCKAPPYEYPAGFYYAIISRVLQHSQEFITAAEQFADSLSQEE
jgi:hypothetical protein